MCDCKKTDGYCGCDNKFDGLFGYKISAEKKEKEAKDSTDTSEDKEKKPKKKLDLAKVADQAKEGGSILDSLLSGFKKKPDIAPASQADPTEPAKEGTNWGMWIGIGAAVVVIVVIWVWSTRKK